MNQEQFVVEAHEMHELEDAILRLCGESGASLACISACLAVLGGLSGLMWKHDAESAWRNMFENDSLRALFVDRFTAMRACMEEESQS